MSEETKKKKKASTPATKTMTIIGYVLIVLFLAIVAPVVCPLVIQHHTYLVNDDSTGLVNPSGSVVYAKEYDSYDNGNIIAYVEDEDDYKVNCAYVEADEGSSISLQDGKTVDSDLVKGHVAAKTPFIGYLCCLCYKVWGIILSVVILVAGVVLISIAKKIRKKRQKEIEETEGVQ